VWRGQSGRPRVQIDWVEHLTEEVEAENQEGERRSKFAGLKELLAGKTAEEFLAGESGTATAA
jgi:hypothetical protein